MKLDKSGSITDDKKYSNLHTFATSSNILIPISLQPDGVNPTYFKLSDFLNFDLTKFIV